MKINRFVLPGIGIVCILILAGFVIKCCSPEHIIGSYQTSLNGRTSSQVVNVRVSCKMLNNVVIMPGQTFSFVKTVGSWTADRGFVKAPVSYDGELINSWGGGVCQSSTTLYNAAALAGLDIIERHNHHWPAKYAPLGRDAAVAYSDIDLKFKNNLPKPIKIIAKIQGNMLRFDIVSTYKPTYKVQIETHVKSVIAPKEFIQNKSISNQNIAWKLVNKGQPGFYIITHRQFTYGRQSKRKLLSVDRYPPMNKIVQCYSLSVR
jgi:vancomycin resistance protein VanW